VWGSTSHSTHNI